MLVDLTVIFFSNNCRSSWKSKRLVAILHCKGDRGLQACVETGWLNCVMNRTLLKPHVLFKLPSRIQEINTANLVLDGGSVPYARTWRHCAIRNIISQYHGDIFHLSHQQMLIGAVTI